jgi:hypothetical protein
MSIPASALTMSTVPQTGLSATTTAVPRVSKEHVPDKVSSPFRHETFSDSPRKNELGFMGHLFPSFDGPVRASPYFCTPRKRRWWPVAAAFGAGVGCVFVLLAPWKHGTDVAARQAPAVQSRAPDNRAIPVEAAPADASPQTASAPIAGSQVDVAGAPAGAPKAAEPMPRARPASADAAASPSDKSASTKSSDTKAVETRGSNSKTSNTKASNTKGSNTKGASVTPPTAAETTTASARDQAESNRNSAKTASQSDQAAGMVRVDEEELPDGRRVPVYRRPTIFDGVRTSGPQ